MATLINFPKSHLIEMFNALMRAWENGGSDDLLLKAIELKELIEAKK